MQNDNMEEPQRRVFPPQIEQFRKLSYNQFGEEDSVNLIRAVEWRILLQLARLVKPGSFFTTDVVWIINGPFISGRFDL